MTFLPGLTTLGKLVNKGWRTLILGERVETWDEKLYSVIYQGFSNVYTFLGPQGTDYLLKTIEYTALLYVGYLVFLEMFESVENARAIRFGRNSETVDPNCGKIILEECAIVSDGKNEERVNSVENPSTCLELESPSAEDKDHPDIERESSVPSDITIVDSNKSERHFLKNLIASIALGDDDVDHVAVEKNVQETTNEQHLLELQESIRQKVDSENCKHFYMLTPWMGDSVEPRNTDSSCIPTNNSLSDLPMIEEQIKADSTMDKNFISRPAEQSEINKKSFVPSQLSGPNSTEAATGSVINDEQKSTEQTMRETTDSTLVDPGQTSSVCYADEVLSPVTDCGKNIFFPQCPSPETEEQHCKAPNEPEPEVQPNNKTERLFENFSLRLPELDLSPISHEREKIRRTFDIAASEIRTDSKHRFRSLSHDNRTASCSGYFDARRVNSVSPPAKNNIKKRTIKQKPSKIPTLSPLALGAMQQHHEIDGSLSETASRIRSMLLRKLKEVWEQRVVDKTPSTNNSRYSSFETSVHSTPEAVSRIPLPRRSLHNSNANYLHPSARHTGYSDRSVDQWGQSGASYSEMIDKCLCPENIDAVPLHSTPKTSPLSRDDRDT